MPSQLHIALIGEFAYSLICCTLTASFSYFCSNSSNFHMTWQERPLGVVGVVVTSDMQLIILLFDVTQQLNNGYDMSLSL